MFPRLGAEDFGFYKFKVCSPASTGLRILQLHDLETGLIEGWEDVHVATTSVVPPSHPRSL